MRMTSKIIYVLLLSIVLPVCSIAQTKFYDATQFPVIGKICDTTAIRYGRLPAYLQNICRDQLWRLGQNSSGVAIRFRSNSTQITAKWKVIENNYMNHMSVTGIKGLDLYAWTGSKWQFVNSARPDGLENKTVIISNMDSLEREYMLYLPLYDGVSSLSIGVDSTAYARPPRLKYPITKKPIVVYGTSITQGGCATRPGMSYTAIIERNLNHEIINLGFSGNGRLDYEIAELMSKRTDAGLFILDFIPNVTLEQVKEKTATFVKKLRAPNSPIPILFVESIIFPHSTFDKYTDKVVADKNKALKEEFEKLKRGGYKNIYYLSSDNLIGTDGEGTVDGVHPTDIGFIRLADSLQKKIIKIQKR